MARSKENSPATRIVQALLVMTMLSAAGALTRTQEGQGRWSVRLRFPDEVDITGMTLYYQLASLGGGAGGGLRIEPSIREYVIDASVGDRRKYPALSFDAIVYCPGYRFVLIREAPPADGSRVKVIAPEFERLGRIPLSGSWVSGPRNITDFEVEATYVAYWSPRFFFPRGSYDGPVMSVKVASAPVKSDGSFNLDVPDFASDPLITSFEDRGSLRLSGRHSTNDSVRYSLQGRGTGRAFVLPIAAQYARDLQVFGIPR